MPPTQPCARCGSLRPSDGPSGLCPACLLQQGLAEPSIPATGTGYRSQTGGEPFVPPTPAELAPLFPTLEIIELLGRGGMGAVYKAKQPRLDRLVALKILPPGEHGDPSFAERFTREARALAKLNHPGIVTIFDFGRAGDLFYFLMEYVDGLDLRRLIQDGQLQPAEALKIIPQICDALQYAHEDGIVHRDIKPENVLIDRKGRVKIADFGLAKLLNAEGDTDRLTGTRQVMGTWRYMAPEQLDNPLGVDHRADIYALGVVFYELLTGELPVGRFAVPSEKAQVDARLDEVVLKALENEPNRRYQHVSEVRSELDSIAADSAFHHENPRGHKERRQAEADAQPVQGDFFNALLAGDRDALKRLTKFLGWIMGAVSTVLFLAWIFGVIPGKIGFFVTAATFMLAWMLDSAIDDKTANKLEAALAIKDPKARDAALPQVALEAAANGEGETVIQALVAITTPRIRDQTAGIVAIDLANAGEASYALYAAQSISDPAERDAALQRLAEYQ